MKFTSYDIRHNRGLKNFIRTSVRTDKTKIVDNYLLNIYDTQDVIETLERKINRHKVGNCAKFVPLWKSHIEALKSMQSS